MLIHLLHHLILQYLIKNSLQYSIFTWPSIFYFMFYTAPFTWPLSLTLLQNCLQKSYHSTTTKWISILGAKYSYQRVYYLYLIMANGLWELSVLRLSDQHCSFPAKTNPSLHCLDWFFHSFLGAPEFTFKCPALHTVIVIFSYIFFWISFNLAFISLVLHHLL